MIRWGPEAAEEFFVHNDGDIQAALSYFPRIQDLLGHPAGK
jgi:hypothetical protein